MRIVLYTGKGGVGKTTVAAASALRCAELGHRTVVLSTDLAHSLADAFDRPLGPEPVEVAEAAEPKVIGKEEKAEEAAAAEAGAGKETKKAEAK